LRWMGNSVNKYISRRSPERQAIQWKLLFCHLQSSITSSDSVLIHHTDNGGQSNRTITTSSLHWHCTRQAFTTPTCACNTHPDTSILLHPKIKTRCLSQPARRCFRLAVPFLLPATRCSSADSHRKALSTSSTRLGTRKGRPIWRLHHSITTQMHDARQLMACRDKVLRNGRQEAA